MEYEIRKPARQNQKVISQNQNRYPKITKQKTEIHLIIAIFFLNKQKNNLSLEQQKTRVA